MTSNRRTRFKLVVSDASGQTRQLDVEADSSVDAVRHARTAGFSVESIKQSEEDADAGDGGEAGGDPRQMPTIPDHATTDSSMVVHEPHAPQPGKSQAGESSRQRPAGERPPRRAAPRRPRKFESSDVFPVDEHGQPARPERPEPVAEGPADVAGRTPEREPAGARDAETPPQQETDSSGSYVPRSLLFEDDEDVPQVAPDEFQRDRTEGGSPEHDQFTCDEPVDSPESPTRSHPAPRPVAGATDHDFATTAHQPEAGAGPEYDPARVLETAYGADERFVIRAFIAEGGFSWVYEAWDRTFQARAAVKISKESCSSGGLNDLRRDALLAREVGTVSGNVVQVYDLGVDRLGRSWMTMEYLKGETLDAMQRRMGGPLPLATVTALVDQIGSALDRAHARGLVHRDLTVKNVMQVGTAGREWFKIIDFGIGGRTDTDRSLAAVNDGAGTPEYMSPEQVVANRSQEISHLSDVYSFGVLLHRVLTGDLPFPIPSRDKHGLLACLHAIRYEVPPPMTCHPEVRSPAAWRGMENLVRRCLEKAPENRPQSMGEVRERFLELAQQAGRRSLPQVDRRAALAAAAVAGTAVLAGLVWWLATAFGG